MCGEYPNKTYLTAIGRSSPIEAPAKIVLRRIEIARSVQLRVCVASVQVLCSRISFQSAHVVQAVAVQSLNGVLVEFLKKVSFLINKPSAAIGIGDFYSPQGKHPKGHW